MWFLGFCLVYPMLIKWESLTWGLMGEISKLIYQEAIDNFSSYMVYIYTLRDHIYQLIEPCLILFVFVYKWLITPI